MLDEATRLALSDLIDRGNHRHAQARKVEAARVLKIKNKVTGPYTIAKRITIGRGFANWPSNNRSSLT